MPVAQATVNGPLHAVPCAHCGAKQDFRELDEQKLLDTGHGITCDNCGKISKIVGIKQIKWVVLKQA